MEIYTGVVQFISCLYVLPVVPFQMKRAGYDQEGTIMATAATCCIGCIIGAFLTDMVTSNCNSVPCLTIQ